MNSKAQNSIRTMHVIVNELSQSNELTYSLKYLLVFKTFYHIDHSAPHGIPSSKCIHKDIKR